MLMTWVENYPSAEGKARGLTFATRPPRLLVVAFLRVVFPDSSGSSGPDSSVPEIRAATVAMNGDGDALRASVPPPLRVRDIPAIIRPKATARCQDKVSSRSKNPHMTPKAGIK